MKGPKVLGIYREPDYGGQDPDQVLKFHVIITRKQMYKLPAWVRDHLYWHYTPRVDHVELVVQGKDELEAFTRFGKLWAGLPKE